MATYVTQKQDYRSDYSKEYVFTGGAAATALADETEWVSVEEFNSVIVTSQIVKAGTTDTATMALFGTNDDGATEYALPNVASTPLVGTASTPTSANTHTVVNHYVFNSSYYGAPKPKKVRAKFTTNGSDDNKNVINGYIRVSK